MITQQEFFVNYPLYEKFIFNDRDFRVVIDEILFSKQSIDCFCIQCEKETSFRHAFSKSDSAEFQEQDDNFISKESISTSQKNTGLTYKSHLTPSRKWVFEFYCDRNHDTRYHFCVNFGVGDGVYFVEKIGQTPTYADIHQSDFRKFKSVLSSEKIKEINTAIGLQAHSASIGGFTYLRRVFEYLVENAHQKAKMSEGWNNEEYEKSRMNEKIKKLNGFLPDIILDIPKLYSILSKGVHELSEEECNNLFDPLLGVVKVILEEVLSEQQKEQAKAEAVAKINSINV